MSMILIINRINISCEEIYSVFMTGYNFTEYFEKAWCIQVIENPIKFERQEHNRFRFWGKIEELDGRVLRVVKLDDKTTIHNAFPDRRFKL